MTHDCKPSTVYLALTNMLAKLLKLINLPQLHLMEVFCLTMKYLHLCAGRFAENLHI